MVAYYNQEIDFRFRGKKAHSTWLKAVAEEEGRRLGPVSVIFCSDEKILEVNRRYLGHDYYTDIITFDYSDAEMISGDLFISIDTVKSNAEFYSVPFDDEIDRVMVHGILHLIGYDDHNEEESAEMRFKENYYLSKRALFLK